MKGQKHIDIHVAVSLNEKNVRDSRLLLQTSVINVFMASTWTKYKSVWSTLIRVSHKTCGNVEKL